MAVTIQDVEYVAELAHLKFEHEDVQSSVA